MVEYDTVNVKLSNSQLNKLKSSANTQAGVNLRMNIKVFKGNNLPHQLLLTTRQKTKLRNTFEKYMSTAICFLKLKYP